MFSWVGFGEFHAQNAGNQEWVASGTWIAERTQKEEPPAVHLGAP